jgi:peptidyl-tRNA hydrolase
LLRVAAALALHVPGSPQPLCRVRRHALTMDASSSSSPPPAAAAPPLATLAVQPPPPPPPAEDASAAAAPSVDGADGPDTIVQFVVVRRDLLSKLEWPTGSVVAQACHACLAVAWEHRDDADVQAYLAPSNIDGMTKVVKEVKGLPQLQTLADKLSAEGIRHKLWLEQPENMPTAIALKPYPRSKVAPLLKKYSLFK